MPKCSIKQCGANNENCPGLSFHRFPTNESAKRKWVDAIGGTNLNLRHKNLWVCSKHFKASDINRTLDVARLRENVVPSFSIEISNSPTRSESPDVTQDIVCTETSNSPTRSMSLDVTQSVACTEASNSPTRSVSPDVTQDVACTEISNSLKSAVSIEKNKFAGKFQSVTNMTYGEMLKNMSRLKRLTRICKNQQMKIKRLHEQVRRRNNKIAILKDIIEHLNEINPSWEQVRVVGRSLMIYQKAEESGADAS